MKASYSRTHYTVNLWTECRRDKTAGRGEVSCHPLSSSPFVSMSDPRNGDYLF